MCVKLLIARLRAYAGLRTLMSKNQGVFGQVQVMEEVKCRYNNTLGDGVDVVRKGLVTAILGK